MSISDSGKTNKPTVTARELLALAVILLLGLMLRIGYLYQIRKAPDFSSPAVDAGFHDYWARAIVSGDWSPPDGYKDPQIQNRPYLRPPGYPYFLALVYWLVGGSYLYARAAQMLLGLVNCVLAWCIGRRLFNPVVGLVFAAFLSFYWVFVYYEGEFLEPVLIIFLLLLAMLTIILWVENLKYLHLVFAGFLFGLSSLVRANCLLFLPVLAIWVVGVAAKKRNLKFAFLSMCILILIWAAVIAPVTVRNYLADDDLVLISANLGVNLLIGNGPNAKGEFMSLYVPGEGTFGSCYDYPVIAEALEKKTGRKLKYSEVSRYLVRVAVRYAEAHPKEIAKLTLRKAYLFWCPRELPHNKDVQAARNSYLLLRVIPLNFPAVLSSSLVGILLLVLRSRSKDNLPETSMPARDTYSICWCSVLFILTYYISYIPFFSSALYRVPLIPFLMLFSAYAVYAVYLYASKRQVRRTLLIAGSVLCLFSVFSIDFCPPVGQADKDFEEGVTRLVYGRQDEAAEQFRKALVSDPNYANAYYGLGVVYFSKGECEQAAEYYRKSLAIKPDSPPVCDNLGSVLLRMGKIEEGIKYISQAIRFSRGELMANNLAVSFVPEYYTYYLYAGNILAQRGQLDEAETLFKMANIMKPDSPETNYVFGKALLQRKKTDQAVTLLKKAVSLDPNKAEAFFMLGKALAEKKMLGAAENCYRKSIQLDPNHPEVYRELEGVLLKQGKPVESKKYRQEFLQKPAEKK